MKTNQKNTDFDFSALATMCEWERQKAVYLLHIADQIGFDYSNGTGCIGVNNSSGYTYLYSENYSFCLFMPISCDLTKDDVWVNFTDFETGEEHEESLSTFESLKSIFEWIEQIQKNETENE
jgi:hypothetical protein